MQAISTMTRHQKMIYSCFCVNLAISGRPSLSQSLADTFPDFDVVENLKFVVGSQRYLSYMQFRRYKYFPVSRQPYRYFRLFISVAITCRHFI